jgi:hypothetical protein
VKQRRFVDIYIRSSSSVGKKVNFLNRALFLWKCVQIARLLELPRTFGFFKAVCACSTACLPSKPLYSPFFIARGTLRKHLFSLFTQELQLNVALESFKSSQPAPKWCNLRATSGSTVKHCAGVRVKLMEFRRIFLSLSVISLLSEFPQAEIFITRLTLCLCEWITAEIIDCVRLEASKNCFLIDRRVCILGVVSWLTVWRRGLSMTWLAPPTSWLNRHDKECDVTDETVWGRDRCGELSIGLRFLPFSAIALRFVTGKSQFCCLSEAFAPYERLLLPAKRLASERSARFFGTVICYSESGAFVASSLPPNPFRSTDIRRWCLRDPFNIIFVVSSILSPSLLLLWIIIGEIWSLLCLFFVGRIALLPFHRSVGVTWCNRRDIIIFRLRSLCGEVFAICVRFFVMANVVKLLGVWCKLEASLIAFWGSVGQVGERWREVEACWRGLKIVVSFGSFLKLC